MKWQQLQFSIPGKEAEFLSDVLLELGAESITLTDAKNQPILEPAPGTTPLWDDVKISALFKATVNVKNIINQIQNVLDNPTLAYHIIPLEDKIWEREWLTHFKPLLFGQHLWITPKEQENLITDPKAVKLILDPGLAFGTGTHPTTALCLEWLATHTVKNKTLMDYGCGSGILGLAACKLGAEAIYFVDNDPQALLATSENAKRNNITTKINICTPTELLEVKADILMANILAHPLIHLAPIFRNYLKIKGTLVLSGILKSQQNDIEGAYKNWIDFHAKEEKEDWLCLIGRSKITF